jgi:hypothetical protein
MKHYPRDEIIASLRSLEIPFPFEIHPTREGVPTIRVEIDGRKVFLHSRFKPLEEADRSAESCDPMSTVVVCGGFGLGYLPSALLSRAPQATVVIIEKEPAIVACALRNNPQAESVLRNERCFLFTDPQDVIAFLQTGISTKTSSYHFHRPSVELFPEFYRDFKNLLLSYLQKKSINIATLARFEKIWARNITKNIRCILQDGGVSEFTGLLDGAPAVLVCAGPSLDRLIPTVKELRKRCLLCAVDSALYRLLRADIMPDIIFTVDPQLLNFYFFFLARKFKLTARLVYEPSTYFRIPNGYPGPRHSFDSVFPLIQWVADITHPKGQLDMGGSVSTSAFDLLYRMGAGQIILAGQDMAFSYNKTHTSGSLVEYVLLKRNTRTRTLETLSNKLTGSNLTVKMQSNAGRTVNSDRRLLLFYWWFENKVKQLENCEVYTLSEEAAAVKGINYVPASEIQTLLKRNPKSFDRESFVLPKPKDTDLSSFLIEAEKAGNALEALLAKINEAVTHSEKAYRAVKLSNFAVIQNHLKAMDEIDRYIQTHQRENRLIGITMQRVIHTIMEDHEDYLTDEEKGNKDLAALRKSIVMYTEMRRSAEYNIGLFKAIRKTLLENL